MKIKKDYVAPQANACNVECESSILVISGSNEVGTAPGVEDEDPNAARGHRGEWGNIWKG
jgi:hypothetical protein